MSAAEGKDMLQWATELFPICRSITGKGLRRTLEYLKKILPELEIHEVPAGTEVFDWTIPNEWNVEKAYLEAPDGKRLIDFKENNLHLVSYSEPVDERMSLEELQPHLHSIPEQPDLIPYRTSYYQRNWGFCLPHSLRASLEPGEYRVFIDSELNQNGSLSYAELYLQGETSEEIMFSTYPCHPSLANDNLSGVVLAAALAKHLRNGKPLRYSYRFLWTPETIGALAWLSRNLDAAKANLAAGFILTCVGDDGPHSHLPSRTGSTLADHAILATLKGRGLPIRTYPFHERGSDERQYCHPAVDLPFASLMRSKYNEYPEYHTSADNINLLSSQALQESFDLHLEIIELLEHNHIYEPTTIGEPQLGKRNLYANLSSSALDEQETLRYKILGHADGKLDLISLVEIVEAPPTSVIEQIQLLEQAGVIKQTKMARTS